MKDRTVLIGGDASRLAQRKLTDRGWNIVVRAPYDGAPTYVSAQANPSTE